jgi:predicted AlkP superfamily phosphohydrolase/phosphomutase
VRWSSGPSVSACERVFTSRDRKGAVGAPLILVLSFLLGSCSHTATQAANQRMIVLGVDGMDPVFVENHWAELPNLARLRTEGDFRRLATTVPPQSPVAWSSVTTGMDPGGHGLFDFIHRNPSNRTPVSSMAEASDPGRTLTIGPYVIPITSGKVRQRRAGRAFWQILAEQHIPGVVIRMPANFPPAECEAQSLAGMGTPDLGGTFGTFTFYTDDPAETRTEVSGGRIEHIKVAGGRAVLRFQGPANPLRTDHAVTTADMVVNVDPKEPVARFDPGDRPFILRQGEWSEWQRVRFPLISGVKSASGIVRIYLQQAHPYLRVYASPINLDPDDPALPISTPSGFSRDLATTLGPYYTQGIAEETAAFRAGLFSKDEFLVQSRKVLADSLRMFRYELDRFQSGLLFYYFSSVDQNAHMLWGKYDNDLLEIYRAVDAAIGEAMKKAGSDTKLLILSDHGFARFDRAVHLNTWLMREGYLVLDDAKNTGDDENFAHVDWSRTQAYAVGLNAIYLNLYGREDGGIVQPDEKEDVAREIATRLAEFKDPVSGLPVVGEVYFPEKTFKGRNLAAAPDLLVGFNRGFRASWQTALGAVPKLTIEDNTQAWIGDHCMRASAVPGVLFSNRKFRVGAPSLVDVPVTILREFGITPPREMIGESVF